MMLHDDTRSLPPEDGPRRDIEGGGPVIIIIKLSSDCPIETSTRSTVLYCIDGSREYSTAQYCT